MDKTKLFEWFSHGDTAWSMLTHMVPFLPGGSVGMTLLFAATGVYTSPQWLTITLVVLMVVLFVGGAAYVSWSAKRERMETREAMHTFMRTANEKFVRQERNHKDMAEMVQVAVYLATEMTPEQASARVVRWGKELADEAKAQRSQRALEESRENN